LLPPSRYQGKISRRFHVWNFIFRPVSSERRTDIGLHTNGLARNYKALLQQQAALELCFKEKKMQVLNMSVTPSEMSVSKAFVRKIHAYLIYCGAVDSFAGHARPAF